MAAGCQHHAHAYGSCGEGEQDALPACPGEYACRQVRVSEGGVRLLGCAAQRVVHADRDRARRVCGREHGDTIAIAARQA